MRRCVIICLVGLSSISFFRAETWTEEKTAAELANAVPVLRGVHRVDQQRQTVRRKVLQILNRFNPDMGAELRNDIANEIYRMSVKYANLDVDLICATITHESARSWNPRVVSNAGALGLMQIMPSTGEWLAGFEGIPWTSSQDVLFNPIYNIRMGSRYLSALIDSYDLEGGLAAYNGGAKRVEMWLENDRAEGILWEETRAYVPYVLKLYDEYKGIAL